MEDNSMDIIGYICIAILIIGFIAIIPYYIFEFKQWKKARRNRSTLSGKKIKAKYGTLIKKMAPYDKRTIFLNDDHSQRCEIDIEVAVKRKCVYVNYIFDFMEDIPIFDGEADYSDDEEEDIGEMEQYDLVQNAAFFKIEECKDKLVITFFNHYEEESFKWKFKTSMSQKQILSLFLDTDEAESIMDDGMNCTSIDLVKDVITGEIGKLKENPFGWNI